MSQAYCRKSKLESNFHDANGLIRILKQVEQSANHLLGRVLGGEVLREDVLHVERDVLHEELALVGERQELGGH